MKNGSQGIFKYPGAFLLIFSEHFILSHLPESHSLAIELDYELLRNIPKEGDIPNLGRYIKSNGAFHRTTSTIFTEFRWKAKRDNNGPIQSIEGGDHPQGIGERETGERTRERITEKICSPGFGNSQDRRGGTKALSFERNRINESGRTLELRIA